MPTVLLCQKTNQNREFCWEWQHAHSIDKKKSAINVASFPWMVFGIQVERKVAIENSNVCWINKHCWLLFFFFFSPKSATMKSIVVLQKKIISVEWIATMTRKSHTRTHMYTLYSQRLRIHNRVTYISHKFEGQEFSSHMFVFYSFQWPGAHRYSNRQIFWRFRKYQKELDELYRRYQIKRKKN